MRSWKFLFILSFVLCACNAKTDVVLSPIGPSESSPILTPALVSTLPLQEGWGEIRGCMKTDSLPWRSDETALTIYAAPFYSVEGDNKGFFLLEPSIHPSGRLYPNGCFQIPNIPPGAYVLVIGPTPEDAMAFRKNNVIRVFHVEANQILDLGELALEE